MFKDYKVQQSWITNCDRFWITKCDKNFENWIAKCNGITNCDKFGLQIAMGLQNAMDYKVIQQNFKRVVINFCLPRFHGE